MDPNETLRLLRLTVKQMRVDTDPGVRKAHADEIAEYFEALDGWIVGGGFLPAAWLTGQEEYDPLRAWEHGALSAKDTINLFSELVRTGRVGALPDAYRNNADWLIAGGFLTADGTITDKGRDDHPEHECADGCGLAVTHQGACLDKPGGRQVCEHEQTWTFVGHWENDQIVVEYVVPGEVDDDREDTGYWDQGLFAAAASGATQEEALENLREEYES